MLITAMTTDFKFPMRNANSNIANSKIRPHSLISEKKKQTKKSYIFRMWHSDKPINVSQVFKGHFYTCEKDPKLAT